MGCRSRVEGPLIFHTALPQSPSNAEAALVADDVLECYFSPLHFCLCYPPSLQTFAMACPHH